MTDDQHAKAIHESLHSRYAKYLMDSVFAPSCFYLMATRKISEAEAKGMVAKYWEERVFKYDSETGEVKLD